MRGWLVLELQKLWVKEGIEGHCNTLYSTRNAGSDVNVSVLNICFKYGPYGLKIK